MRGKYVCIEGPDGGGKTTLVDNIMKLLGRESGAYPARFPSEGPVGQLIRSFLSGNRKMGNVKAMLYLFAADGVSEDPFLRSILEDGRHIICDRHPTLSGRVFQLEHHDYATIEKVYGSSEMMMPDVLFFLDVPVATTLERCMNRKKYKDVVYETESIGKLSKIRLDYELMIKEAARRWVKKTVILDGTRDPIRLAHQVIEEAGLK